MSLFGLIRFGTVAREFIIEEAYGGTNHPAHGWNTEDRRTTWGHHNFLQLSTLVKVQGIYVKEWRERQSESEVADDFLKTAYSRHILTDNKYELTDAKSIPQTCIGPKQTQAPLLANKLIAINTC